jgi:hypothetical protein
MTDQERSKLRAHRARYRKLRAQYVRGLLTTDEYETALAVLHYEWKHGPVTPIDAPGCMCDFEGHTVTGCPHEL